MAARGAIAADCDEMRVFGGEVQETRQILLSPQPARGKRAGFSQWINCS